MSTAVDKWNASPKASSTGGGVEPHSIQFNSIQVVVRAGRVPCVETGTSNRPRAAVAIGEQLVGQPTAEGKGAQGSGAHDSAKNVFHSEDASLRGAHGANVVWQEPQGAD